MLDYATVVASGPLITETVGPLPEYPAGSAPGDGSVGDRTPDIRSFGVRRLSGRRMADLSGVYDECAAALQFPEWFGRNLDAFDECLRDLELPEAPRGAVVLVVTDAAAMLSADPERREWFPDAVADADRLRAERGIGGLRLVFSTDGGSADGDRWWAKPVER